MSLGLLTVILFASVLALLTLGMPIAVAIGGISVIFAIIFWGFDHLYILASAAYSNLLDLNLVAIPLFVFMGNMMAISGMADDLFKTITAWLGGVRGGLIIGTLLIAALWSAMSGELVASIYVISTIALAPMLKYRYDKKLVIGSITAGATMDMLIPPSISAIVFCSVTGLSVGKLYTAMWGPSFLLLAVFVIYIAVRCRFQPNLAPVTLRHDRPSLKGKFLTLRGGIFPILLLIGIMGGIYSGAVSAMEAATVGAVGAFLISAGRRRINWQNLKETVLATLRVSSMVALFLMAIGCFTTVYSGIGALKLATEIAQSAPGGGWLVIIVMQIALLIAGMFLDDFAIIMIFGPIFMNVVQSLNFNTLWFAVLFMVNMQTAFLSPPYGFALFCMKAVVPKDSGISMQDIIQSVIPFIILQVICLIITMIFQPLTTFLPGLLIK